jgi:hypothetical protein
VGGLRQTSAGEFVDILGRIFKSQIINGVLSYTLTSAVNSLLPQPERPQRPTYTPPPSRVDISTLRPISGIGGLGQTSTGGVQSPGGGLPSTPPSNVDVGTLTPVTDTERLKALGLIT